MGNEMQPRELSESLFHDRQARGMDPVHVAVEEFFQPSCAPENARILRRMGPLKDRRLLELGCGSGAASAYFASRGATVFALDISPGMVDLASRLAATKGLKIHHMVGSAGRIPLAKASVDLVYGHGLLHHVDIDAAAAEVARVLRPRGRAFFVDPILYNPAIMVYRGLSRPLHSPEEHPLRIKDLHVLRRHFRSVQHREYWLLSLAVFLKFYFLDRHDPAKVPYWKLIIHEANRNRRWLGALQRLDRALLALFPPLRPLCWNVLLELSEPLRH